MALIKCHECKREVSTEATICPHCGAAIKSKRKIGCLSLIAIVLFLGWIGSSTDKKNDTSSGQVVKSQNARPETRKERIEKSFSAWDGSHRGLERLIKQAMNDPDSYEHVSTTYSDQGSELIVRTTFRGKNAFGGVVINSVVARADLDGNVLEIISQN
ncbi:MAG: zinc-ribbon domain-containing protein [Desulfovibrionaceae bacterium]